MFFKPFFFLFLLFNSYSFADVLTVESESKTYTFTTKSLMLTGDPIISNPDGSMTFVDAVILVPGKSNEDGKKHILVEATSNLAGACKLIDLSYVSHSLGSSHIALKGFVLLSLEGAFQSSDVVGTRYIKNLTCS